MLPAFRSICLLQHLPWLRSPTGLGDELFGGQQIAAMWLELLLLYTSIGDGGIRLPCITGTRENAI